MKNKLLIRIKNSTLIEILAVILIVGFLAVASAVALNSARMKARDEARAGDIAIIKRALTIYFKNSPTGYPASTGECLRAGSGVGRELKDAKALSVVLADPLWPLAAPAQVNGVPKAGQMNFCYFYYSGVSDQFKISFFLEADSRSGQAGINVATQQP